LVGFFTLPSGIILSILIAARLTQGLFQSAIGRVQVKALCGAAVTSLQNVIFVRKVLKNRHFLRNGDSWKKN
jgi:hypothetical protein